MIYQSKYLNLKILNPFLFINVLLYIFYTIKYWKYIGYESYDTDNHEYYKVVSVNINYTSQGRVQFYTVTRYSTQPNYCRKNDIYLSQILRQRLTTPSVSDQPNAVCEGERGGKSSLAATPKENTIFVKSWRNTDTFPCTNCGKKLMSPYKCSECNINLIIKMIF